MFFRSHDNVDNKLVITLAAIDSKYFTKLLNLIHREKVRHVCAILIIQNMKLKHSYFLISNI